MIAQAGIDHWLVFNIGDSRVYRFADDHLEQITVDHSETQELVERGVISESEARTHGQRNVVTRALGADPAPEADWWFFPVVAGERFVVCSDGLFRELSDDEIIEVLRFTDLAGTAAELVARAVAAGGRDNVTVIAIDVCSDEETAAGLDEDTVPRLTLARPVAEVPHGEL
jgi:protein phosphatase